MRTRTVIVVVSINLLSACSSGTSSAAIEFPGTQEKNVDVPTPDQRGETVVTTQPNLDLDVETSTASPALNVRVVDQKTYNYTPLIPRDGIMPIYEPIFVSATQAPLLDEELVMGLTLSGESKAYPITVLRHREMVNDQLGGIPMLVTW